MSEPTTAQLIEQLSQQVSRLLHEELELGRAELRDKAKKLGAGAGLAGTAGVLALYAGGAVVAAVILALALVMDAWLAALIVAVALLVAAGIAALVGKRRVQQAAPPVPTRAIEGLKRDVDAVRHHHEYSSATSTPGPEQEGGRP